MKNFKLTSLVKKFLIKHDCEQGRFLLALSGGCDSLSLFYILLEIFAGRSAPFHVAHIDHGWRDSSAQEAVQLKQLCHKYDLTFHVQTLSPSDAIGNLENHCRNQRLKFFKQVCRQFKLIGVFLGHHQNDQAETILKRVLEGAHWSNLAGISEKSEIGQLKLFRPLLKVSKQQLEDYLAEIKIEPIQDFSNFDSKFLRARMRQKIIPSLEKEFGKNIEKSLVKLANSFQNINRDYDEEVAIYLKKIEQGPFGFYLDFNQLPGLSRSLLDYLLHKISERHAVALSYSQIDLVATFLQKGFANKIFFNGDYKIVVDRRRLIYINQVQLKKGGWKFKVCNDFEAPLLGWQNCWFGKCIAQLVLSEVEIKIADQKKFFSPKNNKFLNDNKVPVALKELFPLITCKNNIVCEFLSGKESKLDFVGKKKTVVFYFDHEIH